MLICKRWYWFHKISISRCPLWWALHCRTNSSKLITLTSLPRHLLSSQHEVKSKIQHSEKWAKSSWSSTWTIPHQLSFITSTLSLLQWRIQISSPFWVRSTLSLIEDAFPIDFLFFPDFSNALRYGSIWESFARDLVSLVRWLPYYTKGAHCFTS